MWFCVAGCVVTALWKSVVPPSSGWNLSDQRLHHADLKQRPVCNFNAKGWPIREILEGGGETVEMTYRTSEQTYISCFSPKKNPEEYQKEFHLNIPPTVKTYQAQFPLHQTLPWFKLLLQALYSCPHFQQFHTLWLKIIAIWIVRFITWRSWQFLLWCDDVWCGRLLKTILSCSGQIPRILFYESALKILFSQAVRCTFTRMYGVTFQNTHPLELLLQDRSFNAAYISE